MQQVLHDIKQFPDAEGKTCSCQVNICRPIEAAEEIYNGKLYIFISIRIKSISCNYIYYQWNETHQLQLSVAHLPQNITCLYFPLDSAKTINYSLYRKAN